MAMRYHLTVSLVSLKKKKAKQTQLKNPIKKPHKQPNKKYVPVLLQALAKKKKPNKKNKLRRTGTVKIFPPRKPGNQEAL